MAVTSVLPNIETERLILRLATRRDRDAILNFLRENKAHLAPFSPLWPKDFLTADYWDFQIDFNIDEFYADRNCRLFIFEKSTPSRVSGNVTLGNIVRNAAQFCYLGYSLAENRQRQGIAREAVRATVDYGFNELKLHRIMANYIPTNERSGNLLRDLGFTVEGYARDYLYMNGKWQDHIMTARTNPNWMP